MTVGVPSTNMSASGLAVTCNWATGELDGETACVPRKKACTVYEPGCRCTLMEAEPVAATTCADPSNAVPVHGVPVTQKLMVPDVAAGPPVGVTVAVIVTTCDDVSGEGGDALSINVDG